MEKEILSGYSAEVIEKARKIKAIFTDVDGVLTSGGIIYDNNGVEYKVFNVKDGQVMKMLKFAGIKVAAITGRESEVVKRRMKEMGMDFHFHGIKDKYGCFKDLCDQLALKAEEVAFLGDDIIDIPVLEQCGLAVCPADAPAYVRLHAHLITEAKGGGGVFRETSDFILAAQGLFTKALNGYIRKNQEHSTK